MREKMIPAFAQAQGGLFAAVEKADVGNAYQEMERQGIALMGWADPFMPDFSMPEAVEQALLAAVKDISAPHYTAPIGSPTLKEKLAARTREVLVETAECPQKELDGVTLERLEAPPRREKCRFLEGTVEEQAAGLLAWLRESDG